MDTAMVIALAVKSSIFLIVLALGLRSSAADAMYLWRQPGRLVRALVAMYVVMPLFALGFVRSFDLYPAVNIALLTLSISPVPPFLPNRALKAGGEFSYACGLLVAAASVAIVLIPLAVALF